MKEFIIENDNQPDIKFIGALLGSVSSAEGERERGEGRWTVLNLYKTKGGKYVCQTVGHTQWEGEKTRHKAEVCETAEDVQKFFGYRWLAKELYLAAGIDASVEIE